MKEERTQTDVMLVIADILASVSDVGTADKIKSLRCKITQNVKDKRNFMNYMLEHVTRMGYELRCLTNCLDYLLNCPDGGTLAFMKNIEDLNCMFTDIVERLELAKRDSATNTVEKNSESCRKQLNKGQKENTMNTIGIDIEETKS